MPDIELPDGAGGNWKGALRARRSQEGQESDEGETKNHRMFLILVVGKAVSRREKAEPSRYSAGGGEPREREPPVGGPMR